MEKERKEKIEAAAHDFAIRFEGVMKELAEEDDTIVQDNNWKSELDDRPAFGGTVVEQSKDWQGRANNVFEEIAWGEYSEARLVEFIEAERTKAVEEDREMLADMIESKELSIEAIRAISQRSGRKSDIDFNLGGNCGVRYAADLIRNHSKKV